MSEFLKKRSRAAERYIERYVQAALAEDPDGSLRLLDHHGQTLVQLVAPKRAAAA